MKAIAIASWFISQEIWMDTERIKGTALLHDCHLASYISNLYLATHLGHLLMKQLELSTSSVDHTLGYAIVQVMFSQQLIMVVSLFFSYVLAHIMCNIGLERVWIYGKF